MRLVRALPEAATADRLETELAGLDTLEVPRLRRRPRLRRIVAAAWPKVVALLIALGLWELVFLSGWKPPWLLPSPQTVFGELWQQLVAGDLLAAVAVTLRRAAVGYGLAVIVGGVIGILVVRSKTLRAAVGSLITGLQTMPSIAWLRIQPMIGMRAWPNTISE